jgi:hypothetical protein
MISAVPTSAQIGYVRALEATSYLVIGSMIGCIRLHEYTGGPGSGNARYAAGGSGRG